MLRFFIMEPSTLTKTRMFTDLLQLLSLFCILFFPLLCFLCQCLCRNFLTGNLLCFFKTKRQLIIMNPKLHWVAHRCKLHQCHDDIRYQAHIKKMLTESTFTANRQNLCTFTSF